jgi:very-short-patch-repair endonuclease
MPIPTKIIKSLKRSAAIKRRKPIRAKGKFKASGANPFKTYRRKRTDAQVLAHAQQCRTERLQNRTKAEMRLCELLDAEYILYEVEKIFLNGDRHIATDVYIKSALLAVEVDGSAHDTQGSYDAGRDRWLFEAYGVRTLRLTNGEVLGKPKLVMQKIHAAMAVPSRLNLPVTSS